MEGFHFFRGKKKHMEKKFWKQNSTERKREEKILWRKYSRVDHDSLCMQSQAS